jgi:hypothetical protein
MNYYLKGLVWGSQKKEEHWVSSLGLLRLCGVDEVRRDLVDSRRMVMTRVYSVSPQRLNHVLNIKPTTGALGSAPKLGRGRAAAVLCEVRRAVF